MFRDYPYLIRSPSTNGGAHGKRRAVTLKGRKCQGRSSERWGWGHPCSPLQHAFTPGRAVFLNPKAERVGVTAAGPALHQSFMFLRTEPRGRNCTRVYLPAGMCVVAPPSPRLLSWERSD